MMMGKLSGRRILVVEDEYFIASDLQRALQAEEAVVIGPVARLEPGLMLVDEGPLDAAVLDVNLEGTASYAIADRLAADGVPYMFVTGYDGWSMPEAYRDAPRVAKPFTSQAFIEALNGLVEGGAA